MLRKTAQGMERLQEDGSWVVVEAATVAPEIRGELDLLVAEHDNGTSEDTSVQEDLSPASGVPDEVLDIAVPGLLSTEGKKSTAGQSRLRKLQAKARKPGTNGSSRVVARGVAPKHIVVPATAAEITGPDADKKLSRSEVTRRIVTRETPVLLENRPKWVQELFEAHFRSELALTLRHIPMGKSGKNRMKLSRADYAIGWLVMFDKAREDPGILRLR